MYQKVIQLKPRDWRAQLNRAVSLLGAGEQEEAKKAFKEAFRMTNRLDIYDAIKHLKQRKSINAFAANAEQSATGRRTIVHGMYLVRQWGLNSFVDDDLLIRYYFSI